MTHNVFQPQAKRPLTRGHTWWCLYCHWGICILHWYISHPDLSVLVQQCTQTSHPATKLDDVVLSLVKISSGIVRLKSSLQRRMASILKCIFVFLYLCHCVFLYFDICELFVVASLVPLSWMFDDSQKRQLSYFWENREIWFSSKWNWHNKIYILCKSEKCQFECICHEKNQILCWFGLNIRNNPILEKSLLISSICNFHHYLEAGANFGTFCNLIDHCSPLYFLLETLCCKTFPSDPHLGDVEQLFLSKSISRK